MLKSLTFINKVGSMFTMLLYTKDIKKEFNDFLQDQLFKTCDLTYKIALKNCKGSYLSGDDTCSWYHSVWQYLRLLDKVSSPTWHFDFYFKEFNSTINDNSKILISGTADYSLLALIHFVALKKKVKPSIWVNDICSTPLMICEYFAKIHNFDINIFQGNILLNDSKEKFDIITSDAFLTRFSFSEKKTVLEKWRFLLNPNGKIITTLRIEKIIKQDEKIINVDKVEVFTKEIEKPIIKSKLPFKIIKLKKLAGNYIKKMVSTPFISINEVRKIFFMNKLNIIFENQNLVKGELKPTKYYQIVAQKYA